MALYVSFLWFVSDHTYIHPTFYRHQFDMSKYVKYVTLIDDTGHAKIFSKMSNLPYFIGDQKLVVYATISMHIVASTIVAYATICSARPMPRVGSSSRQAGRQKSVRSAKICPVCVRPAETICPGRGVSPCQDQSAVWIMDQLIELFEQFDLCQICHILRLPGHSEDDLSIPSHPIAKNLSDLEPI